MVRNIQGLRLLTALPNLTETVVPSTWNTRAWAMQEAELSHSSLIFGKAQVMFRCAQEVFREDFFGEITSEGYREIEATRHDWNNSQALERRIVATEDKDWPMTFEMYARLVQSSMQRSMSYPTDILPAFAGLSQVLHAVCAWKVLDGLIEDVIDYALLWRPDGELKRRLSSNGDPNPQQPYPGNVCLPTYAWCAWIGPVIYESRSYGIRSLVSRFEVIGAGKRKRQIVRFSQDIETGALELSTLEPKYPYAPQDCSGYEDMIQGFYWLTPEAQNLAYRFHLAKDTHQPNVDGPWILHFPTKCVRLVLSTLAASTAASNERKEGCRLCGY
ncbi:MAG: hypothetical protein Q9166_003973 [cf. Caloplaca sp. 2 TL-2023]